jgi:hypothetical protein
VRQRRKGQGGPRRPGGGGRGRPRAQDNVERPRTDETETRPEAVREQPPVEPETQAVSAPEADAPDTTTTKKQVEDPTKLESSGDESNEKSAG